MSEQTAEAKKENGGQKAAFRALSPVSEQRIRTEVGMALEDKMKSAELFIKSGFLPEAIKTPQQALIVMQTGNDLMLTWTEAFRSINVIHGKPSMSAQLLIALCHRTNQVEQAYPEEMTDQKAVFVLKRKGQPAFKSVFTREMADRAKFSMAWDKQTNKWKVKDNWEKQPSVMLMWRSMSQAARFVFPDAICGIYTPEELAEEVSVSTDLETGEVKVVEVLQEPAPKAEAPTEARAEDVSIEGDDVPEDQLGNWTIPNGKYAGRRLIEIAGEQTGTGQNKGINYLKWIVENARDRDQARIVERFLDILKRDGAPV